MDRVYVQQNNCENVDNLIPEDDKTEVVDVLTVVLLHVDPVHEHEDVPNHDHGGLVIVPGGVEGLEEVVVERGEDIVPDLALEMVGDYLLEAAVQVLPVLV